MTRTIERISIRATALLALAVSLLWLVFLLGLAWLGSAGTIPSVWGGLLLGSLGWTLTLLIVMSTERSRDDLLHRLSVRVEERRLRVLREQGKLRVVPQQRVVPLEELVLEFPDSDTPNATQELTEPHRGKAYVISFRGDNNKNNSKNRE